MLVVSRLSFDEELLVRSANEQGLVSRYVYIDRTWENPARLAFFYRMKYAVPATFGLTRHVPSGHLILVGSSPSCQAIEAIDWRNVWNRDYVVANWNQ